MDLESAPAKMFRIAAIPRFVLKTRKVESDEKVFVNILGINGSKMEFDDSSPCDGFTQEPFGDCVDDSFVLRAPVIFKTVDGGFSSIDILIHDDIVDNVLKVEEEKPHFIAEILRFLGSHTGMEMSTDFTLPKTRGNYKGGNPPFFTDIDEAKKAQIDRYIETASFQSMKVVDESNETRSLEKTGTLWTITKNMMMGKRWMQKPFEVKDGVIRYISHGDVAKKNYELYNCVVEASDGHDFSIPVPAGTFPFIINGSTASIDQWKMELCASSSEDRDSWILLLKKFSL